MRVNGYDSGLQTLKGGMWQILGGSALTNEMARLGGTLFSLALPMRGASLIALLTVGHFKFSLLEAKDGDRG